MPTKELRLNDENRELIHKGQLKRRGGTQSETADLEVYLLDNVLVLARYKSVNKTEELRLYKRVSFAPKDVELLVAETMLTFLATTSRNQPIPLELLTMVTQDESYNLSKYGIRPKSLLSRTSTSKSDTTHASGGSGGSGAFGGGGSGGGGNGGGKSNAKPEKEGKHGFSITFNYLGRRGYSLTSTLR